MLVPLNELVNIVAGILVAAGAEPSAAYATAAAIAYAEASGITSHGLVRVTPLADQLNSGKINGQARFALERVGESVVLIDAEFGLGYAAATVATDAVLCALGDAPIVAAAISRSHHFGVAGFYAERIAEAGYVGLAASSTFGAIAPVGGSHPLLGNPPLAVAAPRRDTSPVVIDLAPAVVARGNIAAAAARGEAIPSGWAFDRHGRPTENSVEALKGTMVAMGGPKGVLLAMLIDVLVLCTTRSSLPGEASSVFTTVGPPPQLGHLIIGLNPAALGVPDAADRVERYATALTTDGPGMRVPGERRRQARTAVAAAGGLEVSEEAWRDIERRAGPTSSSI